LEKKKRKEIFKKKEVLLLLWWLSFRCFKIGSNVFFKKLIRESKKKFGKRKKTSSEMNFLELQEHLFEEYWKEQPLVSSLTFENHLELNYD